MVGSKHSSGHSTQQSVHLVQRSNLTAGLCVLVVPRLKPVQHRPATTSQIGNRKPPAVRSGIPLDQVQDDPLLGDVPPMRVLDPEQAADVRVGRRLAIELAAQTAVFAPDGEFLALYEPAGGTAKAVAVFV